MLNIVFEEMFFEVAFAKNIIEDIQYYYVVYHTVSYRTV